MILYDQDFNFIGMSAETLTFLGYEDIDEFTSMHNDFADLFIKKEGFIHRFENFSWIHYILYSGAANKKAYVGRKNGSEVCVDITIKEVFLNHAYDGLRMIYSVKLINENFTSISKTDVHDKRSKQSSEFSLQSLTQDMDMPQQPIPQEETQVAEIAVQTAVQTTKAPEPLDFKLDIPDSSIFQQKEEEEAAAQITESPEPSTVPETKEEEFILNIPDLTKEAPVPEKEKEENNHFNFDTMQQTTQTQAKEEAAPLLSETAQDFAFNLLKNDALQEEEVSEATPEKEVVAQKSEVPELKEEKNDNDVFHFDLLKKEEDSPAPIEEKEPEVEAEEKSTPFAFNLFNTEKREEEKPSEPENPVVEEEAPVKTQQTAFSFALFTEEKMQEEIPLAESSEKASLISQIKSDIEEIDSTEIQIDQQEQENASEKLHELMQKSSFEEEKKEETPEKEKENIFELASLLKTDTSSEKEEKSSPAADAQLQKQENTILAEHTFSTKAKDEVMEESSFEETLKDIFSFEEKQSQKIKKDKKLKLFDTETYIEKNKQHITKEDIKSPFQSDTEAKEELDMPKLGNLGLSKEEELDFIEEFLEDTLATITLMQEYVALEDYDNIKYNLIKISSSAEILHFDQMLEHTRSLSDSCDNKDKNAIVQKLEKLQKVAKQYKEHFTAIAV